VLEILYEEAAESGSCCRYEERTAQCLTPTWVKANWVSSRCWCIGWASGGEAGWLLFGPLTTNLHFPSTFIAIFLKWTIVKPGWCLSVFLPLDVFELLGTSPQNHIWLWCISLFSNFWLPLHSCSVLHDYCSIKAALVQYQILLKEVMLKCLLFMIDDQNFLMSIFVGLSCICKIRHVFSNLSCIRIF